MQNTNSKQGQWLGDVVVKEAGSLEALFDFALPSNTSITDSLVAGSSISYADIVDKRIVNYYQTNSITPATDLIEDSKQGGIGYMGIEINFIVS